MRKFPSGLEDALTGNYSMNTTRSLAIEPEPFETAYSTREMNEIFERGMKGSELRGGTPDER